MINITANLLLTVAVILNTIEFVRLRKKENIVNEFIEDLIERDKRLSNNYNKLIDKTNEVVKANKFIFIMYKESDKKVKRLEGIINKTKKFRIKKKIAKRIYSIN